MIIELTRRHVAKSEGGIGDGRRGLRKDRTGRARGRDGQRNDA